MQTLKIFQDIPNEDKLLIMSQELGIPLFYGKIGTQLIHENIPAPIKWKKLDSFIRNFYNQMMVSMAFKNLQAGTFGDGSFNQRSYPGGTTYQSNSYSNSNAETGGYMVIGTGTNAVAMNDYAMQTLIVDGTGANKMVYGTMEAFSKVYSALLWTITIACSFSNQSGSSITVNEAGIYHNLKDLQTSSVNVLFLRDLVTQAVPNNDLLRIVYQLMYTMPF